MKIVDSGNSLIPFTGINPGTVFKYGHRVYLRLAPGRMYNVVDLRNNQVLEFGPNALVEVMPDAELILNPKKE